MEKEGTKKVSSVAGDVINFVGHRGAQESSGEVTFPLVETLSLFVLSPLDDEAATGLHRSRGHSCPRV